MPGWPATCSTSDDSVACAVALGWYGVSVEPMPLVATTEHDVLRFHRAPAGRLTKVLVDVDVDVAATRAGAGSYRSSGRWRLHHTGPPARAGWLLEHTVMRASRAPALRSAFGLGKFDRRVPSAQHQAMQRVMQLPGEPSWFRWRQ
jgi:hypothetical protein